MRTWQSAAGQTAYLPPGAKHKCTERRDIPGSTAFVPWAAEGLIIAGEVVKTCVRRKVSGVNMSITVDELFAMNPETYQIVDIRGEREE